MPSDPRQPKPSAMRSRIRGHAWDDDDEPTISIVMDPDGESEPRLEVGEDDFIRVEPPPADDWRFAPGWSPREPAIPRPPRLPNLSPPAPPQPSQVPPAAPPQARTAPPASGEARRLPPGRRRKPPAPALPKFGTNSGQDLVLSAPEQVGQHALQVASSLDQRNATPGPARDASMAVMMTPSAPPVMMTPSAPSVMPSAAPTPAPPSPQAAPPQPSLNPPALGGKPAVSPFGVLIAVAAAVVAALVTVALMVWLTEPAPTKPVGWDAPAVSAIPTHSASPAALPSAAASPSPAPPAAVSAPPAASLSLAELAARGDIDAWMQIRARRPEDRTAEESLALARGRSIRKRAALDELAQRLRSDLPLSADRDNLGKLREYLDDGETATDALAVLASIGTPLAVDMIFDVGTRVPAKSDTRAVVDDLLASKDVRAAASTSLAVVLDLRDAEACDDIWRILPRAIENADRRALPELERLRARRGCGPHRMDDCFRCLRGNDVLEKAIRAARSRPAPEI
jgi:hypothetical protein